MVASPLYKSSVSGVPLYCKREDLLPYGGGNKVRRFIQYAQENPGMSSLSAFSLRGSHTFYTLYRISEESGLFSGIQMKFYERGSSMNPYSEDRLTQYGSSTHRISLIRKPFLILLLQYYFRGIISGGKGFTGLGGHVRLGENPFEGAFEEVLEELGDNRGQRTLHVFPVASGLMADGFIKALKKNSIENHFLAGIMTGDRASKPFLRVKYLYNRYLSLRNAPEAVNFEDYERQAREVSKTHGFIPDPQHGFRAFKALETMNLHQYEQIVFWVTNPYISTI